MFLLRALIATSLLFGASPVLAKKSDKSYAITIPLVGKHGTFRGEYNISNEGAVAVEWVEWVGQTRREELSQDERVKWPEDSLISQGRSLGIMLGRYNNARNMSGFHWGLGAGYTQMKGYWSRTPTPDDMQFGLTDSKGLLRHHFALEGPTYSGRAGYRFVGEELGFVAGGYLAYRYFQGKIEDRTSDHYTPLEYAHQAALRRRFSSIMYIGVDIGWAF